MSTVGRAWVAVVLALSLALGLVGPAAARGVAETQFRAAKRAYDKGNYQDALTLFQYAWEQSHSPNARLYIGRCFGHLGNLKAAYDELEGTMREATAKAASDDKYLATRNAAAAELALLESQVGHLVVVLDDREPSATVTLNGDQLPKVSLGDRLTMLPGTAKLVAHAEGRQDISRSVTVAAGKTASVGLWFSGEQQCPAAGAAPSSVSPRAAPQSGWTGTQIVGAVLTGLGVGGLGLAAAMGGAASSKHGALEQACGDARCSDPAFADVVDSGKTYQLISFISLGTGAGLALAGTAMMLFGGASAPSDRGAALLPLPGGGAVIYRASF